MFDFDVLGVSADEGRPGHGLGLATINLNAPVAQVPRSPALMLPPEATVATAIEVMRRQGRRALVVVRQQRPLGVVTERDLIECAARDAGERAEASLMTAMTMCPSPLQARDTVGSALRLMCSLRQWHLPLVCAEGLMIGSIDITDLSLWLRDRITFLRVDAALGTFGVGNA